MNKIIPDIRPKMLTKEMLLEMPPNTIFAHGYMEHLHPWFNNLKHQSLVGIYCELPTEMSELLDDIREREQGFTFIDTPQSKYRLVKWVAVRGGIEDWGIYHSMDGNLCQHDYFDCDCHLLHDWYKIAAHGAKLHDMKEVQRWLPCTEEALSLYRH